MKILTYSLPLARPSGLPIYIARVPAAPFASGLVALRKNFAFFAPAPCRGIVYILLFSLLSSFGDAAQKSASQLLPAHASALQQFLVKHPDLELLSESDYDRETLKEMRKQFGAQFIPYYRVGDFNHDGREDFAVVLAKNTPPKEDPSLADTHRFQHQLAVVVFNGLRGGGYKVAFVKNTTAPLVCFLAVSEEKKSKLYFAVYETDTGFIISPNAQGYIADRLTVGD